MSELLTLKQAADLAGEDISPASLRNAIKRGTLAGERLGRDYVVTRQAVEAWLRTRPEWAVRGGRERWADRG